MEYIEPKQTQARTSVVIMRNNLDRDVTKSYRMNAQFVFEYVLCWLALGSSAVARVSEPPPEISRGAPHTLLAYYYELQ